MKKKTSTLTKASNVIKPVVQGNIFIKYGWCVLKENGKPAFTDGDCKILPLFFTKKTAKEEKAIFHPKGVIKKCLIKILP